MERLRAVSEILGTFEDTAFTVIRSPASAAAAAAGKGSVGAILENLNTLFKSFDFTRKSGKKPGADLNSALAASSTAAAAAVSAARIPEVQIDLLLSMLSPTKKKGTTLRRPADIDFTDILTF